MRNPNRWPVVALVSTFGLLMSCSSSEQAAPELGATESAAIPLDELRAKIVSVTTSGDLCPQWTIDDDHDGLPDNISISLAGDLLGVLTGPEALPLCSELDRPVSSEPRCSVTIEVEVPAGFQMGAPTAVWRGFASGPAGSISATRSYGFENGESSTTPVRSDLERDFIVADRAVPAFSPTCSGQQRVRLTASFQGKTSAPASTLKLDAMELRTSFRQGTEFKDGCSPGKLVQAAPALAGEWCAGGHRRPCTSGLECEYASRQNSVLQELDEGTCVDASVSLPAADLLQPCGGFRNIPCGPGAVCWHSEQRAVDQKWLGFCVSNPASSVGAPCKYGVPAVECAAPLGCWEGERVCVDAQGRKGDKCGPGLPQCESSLFCGTGQICELPDGRAGHPCGDPRYPACRGTSLICTRGVCNDPRSKDGEACGEGTPGCRKEFTCVNNVCRNCKP